MKTLQIGLGAAVLVSAISATAQAGITVYTDRGSWLAAAGVLDFSEDFSGFGTDTEFRTTTVAANGFTLQQAGSNFWDFRNLVETPPFDFTDNNGTNHASCFVNQDITNGDTSILVTPDADLLAWGADFYRCAGAETLDIVLDGVLYQPSWTNDIDFFGFVATPDSAVSLIELTARMYINDGTGEGFGMDDVEGVFPAPSVLALLGLGLVARTRRR